MVFQKLMNMMKKNKPAYLSLRGRVNSTSFSNLIEEFTISSGTNSSKRKKKKDKRKVAKPVDVFNEILKHTPTMDLNDLPGKIKIVNERIKALKSHFGKTVFEDETRALQFLNARKKFMKNKHLFDWPTTELKLIKKLCKKYKLKMSNAYDYYKTIPKEGVDEMGAYAKAFRKITGADPTFKIIVDDQGKEDINDPILLGESPFGDWYYALGAWDKEIEVVDQIIYDGK